VRASGGSSQGVELVRAREWVVGWLRVIPGLGLHYPLVSGVGACPSQWWALCAVISLAEGSVCVASAFTIATGKHIGDCDPLCAFDLSFVHTRTSAGSRCGGSRPVRCVINSVLRVWAPLPLSGAGVWRLAWPTDYHGSRYKDSTTLYTEGIVWRALKAQLRVAPRPTTAAGCAPAAGPRRAVHASVPRQGA
jgi:hypothetical protein